MIARHPARKINATGVLPEAGDTFRQVREHIFFGNKHSSTRLNSLRSEAFNEYLKKQFNKNTKYKLANLQLCCKQPLNGLIQAVKSSPQHIVFGTRVSFVTYYGTNKTIISHNYQFATVICSTLKKIHRGWYTSFYQFISRSLY